jgi:hypothetical protein
VLSALARSGQSVRAFAAEHGVDPERNPSSNDVIDARAKCARRNAQGWSHSPPIGRARVALAPPASPFQVTMLHHIIFAMGVGRVLGLVPFVAARTSARLLGFPLAHDTPTTRMIPRWFGVRDVGLGAQVFYALSHADAPGLLPWVVIFNAFMDLGDLIAIVVPLVRRQGIDRAAWTSLGFALSASAGWRTVFAQLP